MKLLFKIVLLAVAWLAVFIVGASSGVIHPACYAYAGAVMPLLFAFVYLYGCTLVRRFGVATALNGILLVAALLTGEADTAFIFGVVLLTALTEIIRKACGYDTLKGVRRSFLPLAYSFFAYSAHWWTDTEGSLAAAVEEMPAGYDELMRPVIDNIPMLTVALLLTIPVAVLSMRLAEQVLRKQAATLK